MGTWSTVDKAKALSKGPPAACLALRGRGSGKPEKEGLDARRARTGNRTSDVRGWASSRAGAPGSFALARGKQGAHATRFSHVSGSRSPRSPSWLARDPIPTVAACASRTGGVGQIILGGLLATIGTLNDHHRRGSSALRPEGWCGTYQDGHRANSVPHKDIADVFKGEHSLRPDACARDVMRTHLDRLKVSFSGLLYRKFATRHRHRHRKRVHLVLVIPPFVYM